MPTIVDASAWHHHPALLYTWTYTQTPMCADNFLFSLSLFGCHQVAKTLKIGTKKVLAVRNLWYDEQELYEITGEGRGKISSDDDERRLLLTKEQEDELHEFTKRSKAGRQVFRRTVKDLVGVFVRIRVDKPCRGEVAAAP